MTENLSDDSIKVLKRSGFTQADTLNSFLFYVFFEINENIGIK